jgi:GH24 family phage-related lysozyme (muramidase)
MKIIITESQYNLLKESLVDDEEFRETIKSYESTVTDPSGKHYTFDDKDPKNPKTFIKSKSPYGGVLTIGWGHTGEKAKPGKKITNSEAEQLLSQDIKKEEQKAKNIFPKYNTYPLYVQRALTNATYRGEAKTNYEWVKLINDGKWEKASEKYLEGWNIDFSKAKDPRYKGGVAERMTKNQEAFKKYAKELKGGDETNITKNTPTKSEPTKPETNKETEEQRCKKMQPKDLLYHPECDKYFKNDYKMDYGIKLKNFYEVKKGDTLSNIAAKYPDKTITAASIKKLNNLKSDNIEPGQMLKIK